MRVIVNADDLGINAEVNAEIENFIEKGIVSSSTILANGKDFHLVPDIVKRHPNISFGVHLNLSEFESLTKSPVLMKYGITNRDGVFVKGAINNVCFTKELKKAIFKEWRAQIIKVREAGILISHIDGHHHCHAKPELYVLLKRLADNFGIREVRQNSVRPFFYMQRKTISDNGVTKSEVIESNSSQKKLLFRQRITNIIKGRIWYYRTRYDFLTTDLFLSYSDFVTGYDSIRRKKQVTIELMCHPGHPKYKAESELLLVNSRKQDYSFTLVSYWGL